MRRENLRLRASTSRDAQIDVCIRGTEEQVDHVRAAIVKAVAEVAEFPEPPDFKPTQSSPPRKGKCTGS